MSTDRCGTDVDSSSCGSQTDPLKVSCLAPLKGRAKTFHCAKAKTGLNKEKSFNIFPGGQDTTYVTPKDTARMITVILGGEYPVVKVSCKTPPVNVHQVIKGTIRDTPKHDSYFCQRGSEAHGSYQIGG